MVVRIGETDWAARRTTTGQEHDSWRMRIREPDTMLPDARLASRSASLHIKSGEEQAEKNKLVKCTRAQL